MLFLLTLFENLFVTAQCSKEKINFLDVNVRLRNKKLEIVSHVKPTDIDKFLDSTSCHPFD